MSVIEITPTVDPDLPALAAALRPEDAREVWLSHRHTPAEALRASVRGSVLCWTARDATGPFAAFGLGGAPLALTGAPWMLGTTRLSLYARDLARHSRPWVRYMRQAVVLLENWVWADNMTSVRWLRSCGFTLEPAAPFGPFGAPFHRFWMKGDLHV